MDPTCLSMVLEAHLEASFIVSVGFFLKPAGSYRLSIAISEWLPPSSLGKAVVLV